MTYYAHANDKRNPLNKQIKNRENGTLELQRKSIPRTRPFNQFVSFRYVLTLSDESTCVLDSRAPVRRTIYRVDQIPHAVVILRGAGPRPPGAEEHPQLAQEVSKDRLRLQLHLTQ